MRWVTVLRGKITYANVTATLALVLAMAGGAGAAKFIAGTGKSDAITGCVKRNGTFTIVVDNTRGPRQTTCRTGERVVRLARAPLTINGDSLRGAAGPAGPPGAPGAAGGTVQGTVALNGLPPGVPVIRGRATISGEVPQETTLQFDVPSAGIVDVDLDGDLDSTVFDNGIDYAVTVNGVTRSRQGSSAKTKRTISPSLAFPVDAGPVTVGVRLSGPTAAGLPTTGGLVDVAVRAVWASTHATP